MIAKQSVEQKVHIPAPLVITRRSSVRSTPEGFTQSAELNDFVRLIVLLSVLCCLKAKKNQRLFS